jgi:hypothetical protein
MGTRCFLGGESGRGVTLTPHPFLVPRSKNNRVIPLLSLRAFMACEKGETFHPSHHVKVIKEHYTTSARITSISAKFPSKYHLHTSL